MRAIVAGAMLAGACGPASIPGEQIYRGETITVHADPKLPVCAPSLARADDFVRRVATYLDVATPDVTYYLYDAPGAPGGCHAFDQFTDDCTNGETVRAGRWTNFHELVHATAHALGRPPAILTEGLAEGLSTTYPQLTVADRQSAPIDRVLDNVGFFTGSPDEVVANYSIAADFDDYLLGRFGVSAFRRVFGQLLDLDDPITIRRAFAHELGVPWDELVADWRAHVPAPSDGTPHLLLDAACAAPALAPDETLACVSGVSFAGATLVQPEQRTLDVTTAGLYALEVGPSPSETTNVASLTSCAGGPTIKVAPISTNQAIALVSLPAARHAIDLYAYEVLPPSVAPPLSASFTATRLGDEAADCASAPIVTAPSGAWELSYATPPDEWAGHTIDPDLGAVAVSWLRIDPGATPPEWAITWVTLAPDRRAKITLCSGGCGAQAGCLPFTGPDGSMRWQPAPGAPVTIELRAPVGSDPLPFEIVSLP
jgi:hypothetical protein